MRWLSGLAKKSPAACATTCWKRAAVGRDPPFALGPGNGRTHTSPRPVSCDVHATHRPSGENTGSNLENGVLRNSVGLLRLQPDTSSPSIGSIIRSPPARAATVNAKNFPVGCQDPASCQFRLSVNRYLA